MTNQKHRVLLATTLALLPLAGQAKLKMLADEDMSRIDGQSGLTLDMSLKAEIGEIAYFDDGNGLQFQNIRLGSAADVSQATDIKLDIDVGVDGDLLLAYDIKPTRIAIGDVRLDDDATASFGSFGVDFAINGTTRLSSDGVSDPTRGGVGIDMNYALTDGRFIYQTNGNEIYLEDITMNVNAPGMVWEPSSVGGIDFRIPQLTGDFSIGAVRFNKDPAGTLDIYDKSLLTGLPSYGSFRGNFDLSMNHHIQGGGKYGSSGITIDSHYVINNMDFIYTDDGVDLALMGITGAYDVNGMHIDVARDSVGDKALSIAYDQVVGEISVADVLAGSAQNSFGGFRFAFDWSDQVRDGVTYTNQYFIKGGGNPLTGNQGMTIEANWSLKDGALSYIDDGNQVMLSGLRSWGQGVVTVDVTQAGTINGQEFYDGLRFGFENIKGGYTIDGLKVGKDGDNMDNKSLQGGTELLLALGIFPAYDFNIDGQITLGAGGQTGEGITINSDVVISQANAALMVDENEKGLWMTGMNYDIHLRDMTIDMVSDGIQFVKGEKWATMDISDLRVGSKDDAGSFGRFVVQTYEQGSTMVISPGGAGDVCIGANASSAGGCSSAGGVWEQRGDQGVTIRLKQIFAEKVSDIKQNRFVWETNRTSGNGSGVALAFNNISTNDASDSSNTYGFRNDISIDVHQTKVLKKEDGPDSNGVVGNKGDEKIMDSSSAGYHYVSAPTSADIENRPLGFAVQAHTHFKELSVENVTFEHPNSGPAIGIHGLKLNNFSIRSNLTATPID